MDLTDRTGEAGLGLVESIIGLLVLTIVLLAGGQLFRVHVEHLALVERARRADSQANALMNALCALNLSQLPEGNPFVGKGPSDTLADGEKVLLDNDTCQTAGNCDMVARVSQATGTGADHLVIPWNGTVPEGGWLVYYRAWRVTTLDSAKGLRRITLVILPVEPESPSDTGGPVLGLPGSITAGPGAIEPLVLRHTDVVQRQ
jgi:hypothetical protein